MTQPQSRSLTIPGTAWLGILAVATLWGASFLSIRVALREVPVFTLVMIRVGGAALVLWAWVLLRGLPVPRGWKVWAGIALMGLINNVIPFSLITWGQQHIDSGLAAILNASTAVFGTLIAALVFADERLTGRKVLGVGIGFAGVAVAMGIESLAHFDLTSMGQLALIGASLSYGLAGSWARIVLRGVSPTVAAAGMLTASTLMLAPVVFLREGVPHLAHSAPVLAAMFYLAVFASALAFLIFYRVLTVVGAANLSLVTLLVAPIAILLGAVVLGESLRPAAYDGFGLLALGLIVIDGRAWDRVRSRVGRARTA